MLIPNIYGFGYVSLLVFEPTGNKEKVLRLYVLEDISKASHSKFIYWAHMILMCFSAIYFGNESKYTYMGVYFEKLILKFRPGTWQAIVKISGIHLASQFEFNMTILS